MMDGMTAGDVFIYVFLSAFFALGLLALLFCLVSSVLDWLELSEPLRQAVREWILRKWTSNGKENSD